MLELKNIVKVYPAGGTEVRALKGVSLKFRNSEFVSILGPSGCGKTTMLNIIGGLDHYTEGDILINGRSTKEYKDRDWDDYRNHTIGFVFQSYNLIPHQTVLQNVELALTLSGVSKGERKKRAIAALESVGLGSQLNKRPAQMSGGQMQRVAIARAIVNDPDIILADEPTGALDSETSVQVMEILKNISENRLVIMVTHNPELAEEYSTRIIRMMDGKVLGDTMPISEKESVMLSVEDAAKLGGNAAAAAAAGLTAAEIAAMGLHPAEEETAGPEKAKKKKKQKKASMSFATAFSLSLKNLFTKRGRTMLTSFAGSIGIIGIALITAVSQGTSDYIAAVQEDTLSNYPLTIMKESGDIDAIMTGMGSSIAGIREAGEEDLVEMQVMNSMFGGVVTNDLESFKSYLEENYDEVAMDINSIRYDYSITPQIYTRDVNDHILRANPAGFMSYFQMSGFMSSFYNMNVFTEMIPNTEVINEQYDILKGRLPESYDEVILVLSGKNQISDMVTYAIGLHDPEQLSGMIKAMMNGESFEVTDEGQAVYTYDDIMNLDFRLVLSPDIYRYNSEYNLWEDMSDDEKYMDKVYADSIPIHVTGIVCPKEGASATALSSGFNYLPSLTRYVMDQAADAKIVGMQLDKPEINVFSGKGFGEKTTDSGVDFESMFSFDEEKLQEAFKDMMPDMDLDFDMSSMTAGIDTNAITQKMASAMENALANISLDSIDTEGAKKAFNDAYEQLAKGMLNDYVKKNKDSHGKAVLKVADADKTAENYLKTAEAGTVFSGLTAKFGVTKDELTELYQPVLSSLISSYVLAANSSLTGSGGEINTPAITLPTASSPEETQPASEEECSAEESTQEGSASSEEESSEEESSAEESSEADPTLPSLPDYTLPSMPDPSDITLPSVDTEAMIEQVMQQLMTLTAPITADDVDGAVSDYSDSMLMQAASSAGAARLVMPQAQNLLISTMSGAIANALQDVMKDIGGDFSSMMPGGFNMEDFNMDHSDGINMEAMSEAFSFNMAEEDVARLMSSMYSNKSAASYGENLLSLGYAREEDPSQISVYLKSFEAKDHFKEFLDAYNQSMEDSGQKERVISYTDITGVLMSSVTTIINAITYVLIAFVAISLIVSSIMIGVITLISVQERTKEIGILRAIGASKKNVSSMFNAETVIIGFTSGLLGVVITYILTIPINIILHKLTGIETLSTRLPVIVGVILILISMLLTLIAGIIPSGSAAKKDPVTALRSE